MKRWIIALAAFAFLSLGLGGAKAQAPVSLYCWNPSGSGLNQFAPCNAANPLVVSASVSASITGFPGTQSTGTPISVTTGGVTGNLPAGTVVVASNVGTTNNAYCKLGASATTSDQLIAPNSWFAFTVGASTQLTCITSTSTTTINMVGGSGLPTGAGGGGGSGGGGGGAITAASGAYASGAMSSGSYASGAFAAGAGSDGWDVSEGATTASAATVGSAGSLNAKMRLVTTQLDNINTNIQAGSGAFGSTFPTSGIAIGYSDGTNLIAPIKTAGIPTSPTPYPVGAVPITASATGTTAATTATLAGTSGKTTYICGYSIRANATAAATVTNTITGVITATLSSIMWVAPLASGIGIDEQIFSPCIPASATNTGIAIVSGAPGSGGAVSSKGWGYQL